MKKKVKTDFDYKIRHKLLKTQFLVQQYQSLQKTHTVFLKFLHNVIINIKNLRKFIILSLQPFLVAFVKNLNIFSSLIFYIKIQLFFLKVLFFRFFSTFFFKTKEFTNYISSKKSERFLYYYYLRRLNANFVKTVNSFPINKIFIIPKRSHCLPLKLKKNRRL